MWKWLLMVVPAVVVFRELLGQLMNPGQATILSLLFLCAGLGFAVLRPQASKDSVICLKTYAISALISALGAMLVYVLANTFQLGAIAASGLVGIAAARILPTRYSFAAYTGAFVGMSTPLVIPSVLIVGITGLFSGTIYELLDGVIDGVGGRLGTMAATSVIVTLIISGRGGF